MNDNQYSQEQGDDRLEVHLVYSLVAFHTILGQKHQYSFLFPRVCQARFPQQQQISPFSDRVDRILLCSLFQIFHPAQEQIYSSDSNSFIMPLIQALCSYSCKVLSIDILSEQTSYMPRISWDMLSLQLMRSASNPSDSVLDMVVVGNIFGRVHLQLYLCDNIYRILAQLGHIMANINNWHMKKRIIYPHVPLFQIKKVAQDEVAVHVPVKKRVDFYDIELSGLRKSLSFSREMQAIEKVEIADGIYLMAGLKNGIIQGRRMDSNQQHKPFKLSIPEEIMSNAYINDILEIGDGRIVNCYNSGNLAIWNLNKGLCQQQSESYIRSVHQSYVYKLRQYCKGKIVSCGHDNRANLIDLVSGSTIASLYHSQSVWCCYPINQNTLVSAGLIGSLTFWDVRMARKIQVVKIFQDQTSFITRLSPNQIVFGEKRWLKYCDLRKMKCDSLSINMMRQSGQNIIVLPEGGIVAGRGGDICLFKNDEQPESEDLQEHIVQNLNSSRILYSMQALIRREAARIQIYLQGGAQNNHEQQEEGQLYELEGSQQEQQWENQENSEQDEDIQ